MAMEERLLRRDVIEQSPRDVCVLTHKALGKSILAEGAV